MKTKRKYRNNIIIYLKGEYEIGVVKYKIIGYVYDRELKIYLYNLMREDKVFVIRDEDYIERNITNENRIGFKKIL